jgi:hypothetical protein
MDGIKQIPKENLKNHFLNHNVDSGTREIILLHFGTFTDVKINSFLKIVEDSVLEIGSKRQIMRRLCSLLVETLQNTYHHSYKDNVGNRNSALCISHDENSFYISTGNLISAEDIIPLTQKLSSINGMNANELRKLYIETLCNDNFNQKGGAGLGFLTMAKKVHGKLNYEFFNVAQKAAYFILNLEIAKA